MGVAVKVTDAPVQVGLVPDVIAITTDGTTLGFTVMVIELDVAVVTVAHGAFDVIMQVTICPVVKVVVVNVAAFVPAFTPFTCH